MGVLCMRNSVVVEGPMWIVAVVVVYAEAF